MLEDVFGVAFLLIAVMALDQQPVVALAALAVVAQAHQHPAALQLLAGKRELELALAQGLGRHRRRSPRSRGPRA